MESQQELEQNIYQQDQDVVYKIELFISCRRLHNINPVVLVYLKYKSTNWKLFGKTEVKQQSNNPDFSTSFLIDYFFEKHYELRFDILNVQRENKQIYVGSVYSSVGSIFGAKNQTVIDKIKDYQNQIGGVIILRAEKNDTCYHKVNIQFKVLNVINTGFLFRTNPYLKLYKKLESQDLFLIYESEVANGVLNYEFQSKQMNLGKLCSGNYYTTLILELWDKNNFSCNGDQLLGECQFSLNTIQKLNIKSYQFMQQKIQVGTVEITQIQITQEPCFMDYIRGGLQLNVIGAIDFTSSNGDPSDKNSYHSIHQQGINQYQNALSQTSQILLNYDYDKIIPLFGFGGIPRMPNLNQNIIMHCFPLNGDIDNPGVKGQIGMLESYKYALQYTQLAGPTLFNPIIQQVQQNAQIFKTNQLREHLNDQYIILLMLTDGVIDDMTETVRTIVQCDKLPMSIIIIGIGDGDFEKMIKLDCDNGTLIDDLGNESQRDLVQFVPFNNYNKDPQLLAEKVCEELPKQIEQYMKLVERLPNQKQEFQSFLSLTSISDDNIQNNRQYMIERKQTLIYCSGAQYEYPQI